MDYEMCRFTGGAAVYTVSRLIHILKILLSDFSYPVGAYQLLTQSRLPLINDVQVSLYYII